MSDVPEMVRQDDDNQREAGFYWVKSFDGYYDTGGWNVARWEPGDKEGLGWWFSTAYKGMYEDGNFEEIGPKIEPPIKTESA